MYDLSGEFQRFYNNEVILSQEEIGNLREKKRINIDRLKSGLKEYNEENNTDYKIIQIVEQGSVPMKTIIKNNDRDYDIDVAIIFDKENIENIGPNAIQNIIIDALKRKCINMKTPPYSKTNCVRIEYADNYHIDFAIYRREKNYNDEYIFEHAGSEWRERNPYAINNWFKEEIEKNGQSLRKVVRLSKFFCNSRNSWNMPGGLIQTVLADENIKKCDRLDECFYKTIVNIKNRLLYDKDINNPVNNQNLILTEEHKIKVENLYNRLNTYIEKLNILFDTDCTFEKACNAWYEFFNTEYWKNVKAVRTSDKCEDTEEYIYNIFPVFLSNKYISLDCRLRDPKGKLPDRRLSRMLENNEKIPIGYSLNFYIEHTNVNRPYDVYWKIKNNGNEAVRLNEIRGEIFKAVESDDHQHMEYANFGGNHYVECFIVKNNICVASERIEVPIK